MRLRFVIALGFVIILVVPYATSAEPSVKVDRSVLDSLNTLVRLEIAAYPSGEYLFKHSEIFARIVRKRAMEKLGVSIQDLRSAVEARARKSELLPQDDVPSSTQDISNDYFDQDETSVAVSRKDPRLVVVGANDADMFDRSMPVYFSTNAGRNWSTTRLPKLSISPYGSGGDPALAAAADGTLYYGFLIFDYNSYYSNLIVARSSDGMNWEYGSPVLKLTPNGEFSDKENIAVDRDPNSPYYGRVYVSWLRAEGDSAPKFSLRLAWSDDRCNTWSSPVDLTEQVAEFSQVAVGKGGVVIVSYSEPNNSLEGEDVVEVSRDGGQTFERHSLSPYRTYPYNAIGYSGLKGWNGFRSFPYVSIAVDEGTNRIHAVYGSYVPTPDRDSVAALSYSVSDDFGANWSQPAGISLRSADAPQADRFHPWVSLDQNTQECYVSFCTSELDTGNLMTGVVRGKLGAPGVTEFTELDDSLFNPLLCESDQHEAFIGDYTGADAFAGTFAAAWTENRKAANDGEIFAYVSSPFAGVQRARLATPTLTLSPPAENPVLNGSLELSFTIPSEGEVTMKLFDERGRAVQTVFQRHFAEGRHQSIVTFEGLASGVYFCRLQWKSEEAETRIVLVR